MSTIGPSGTVYTGTWTNWAQGYYKGATLTLSNAQGAYLIAFLAIYVQVAGNHFWNLFCYLAFRFRATTQQRDGLYFQQQAILRNTTSPLTVLLYIYFAIRAWYKRANRPVIRCLSFILFALLHLACFTLAGIFSSQVTATVSDVLLKDLPCGGLGELHLLYSQLPGQQTRNQNATRSYYYTTHIRSMLIKSASYANNCNGTDNSFNNCAPFGRKFIDFETTRGVECPFESSMCLNDTSIRLDTGVIDSDIHFGINSRPADRLGYRRVMQCSPIRRDGFESDWKNASDPDVAFLISEGQGVSPDEFLKTLNYGPSIWIPQQIGTPDQTYGNMTFVFDNRTSSLLWYYNLGRTEYNAYIVE
jgi:hypothetical protein